MTLKALCLALVVCITCPVMAIGSDPYKDPHNVHKYLKAGDNSCLSSDPGCVNGSDPSIKRFQPRNGYYGFPYGLSGSHNTFSTAQIGKNLDPSISAISIPKYSGNTATYSTKHYPVAVGHGKYTYFVYSGVVKYDNTPANTIAFATEVSTSANFLRPGNKSSGLGIYIGRYEHDTNQFSSPVLLHVKGTDDPHDNATINVDSDGYLYVLVSGRGIKRGSFLFKTNNPASSDNALASFTDISVANIDYSGCFNSAQAGLQNTATNGCGTSGNDYRGITYPKMFWMGDHFRLIYTVYCTGHDNTCRSNSRQLYTAKLNVNGNTATVSEIRILAAYGGHYAIANQFGNKLVVAFNYHKNGSVNDRTNLYALMFDGDDMNCQWKRWSSSGSGQLMCFDSLLPITTAAEMSLAAIKEYNESYYGFERGIYLKDILIEEINGQIRPIVLYVGSKGGAGNYTPHIPNVNYDHYLAVAYWNGASWVNRRLSNDVDHNFTAGMLYKSPQVNPFLGRVSVVFPATHEANNNALAGGERVLHGTFNPEQLVPGPYNLKSMLFLTNPPSSSLFPGDHGYLSAVCEYNYVRSVHRPNSDGKFVAILSAGNPYKYVESGGYLLHLYSQWVTMAVILIECQAQVILLSAINVLSAEQLS